MWTNFEKSEAIQLRAYQVISENSHHILMQNSFCIIVLMNEEIN